MTCVPAGVVARTLRGKNPEIYIGNPTEHVQEYFANIWRQGEKGEDVEAERLRYTRIIDRFMLRRTQRWFPPFRVIQHALNGLVPNYTKLCLKQRPRHRLPSRLHAANGSRLVYLLLCLLCLYVYFLLLIF